MDKQTVLVIFVVYLLLDMVLGYKEYRTEFGMLSGCELLCVSTCR